MTMLSLVCAIVLILVLLANATLFTLRAKQFSDPVFLIGTFLMLVLAGCTAIAAIHDAVIGR